MGKLQGHPLPGQPRDNRQGHCSPVGGPGRAAGWVWRAKGAGSGPGMMVGAVPLYRCAGMHLVPTHAHASETTPQPHRDEQSEGHQCVRGPGSWLLAARGTEERGAHTYTQPWLARPARSLDTPLTHNHTRDTCGRQDAPEKATFAGKLTCKYSCDLE